METRRSADSRFWHGLSQHHVLIPYSQTGAVFKSDDIPNVSRLPSVCDSIEGKELLHLRRW